MRPVRLLFSLALVLRAANAQTVGAGLHGTLTDATGAVVASAAVQITNTGTPNSHRKPRPSHAPVACYYIVSVSNGQALIADRMKSGHAPGDHGGPDHETHTLVNHRTFPP
jgi:hypothetical protein